MPIFKYSLYLPRDILQRRWSYTVKGQEAINSSCHKGNVRRNKKSQGCRALEQGPGEVVKCLCLEILKS